MGGKRQKIQLELAFNSEDKSEALRAEVEGIETPMAGIGLPLLSEFSLKIYLELSILQPRFGLTTYL